MPSTFFGLTIAGSGLSAYQTAINTTANNISNEKTEGYTRQEAMMQAARQKVFIADHSKFGRIACMNVCGIDEMETIVSDSRFPEELREPFMARGVKICTP